MQILCHRGWWSEPGGRNGEPAISRAITAGLGVETDLRDHRGEVVVSHDPPTSQIGLLNLDDLLKLVDVHGERGPERGDHARGTVLALNVKADGLAAPVSAALASACTDSALDAFVFDMSVPDLRAWIRRGVPVFTRHSDLEPSPVLYEQAAGVWLDDFGFRPWWTARTVTTHLCAGKRVAIVSPELHGRDHRPIWDLILDADLHHDPSVMLCTDLPGAALQAFR